METIQIAGLCSLALSILALVFLIIVLSVYSLPRTCTGLHHSCRLSIPSLSLLISTAVFSGKSVLDYISRSKTGSLECTVDAILETYLKTAIIGHVSLISFLHSICIPSPSLPDPTPISTTKSLILLSLVYTYAVFPLIPTISTAASAGFKLEEGYGKWWGNYCIDKSNWWRIVRPITLLPLLILTIYLCFITLSSLYSNIGHPSLYIRPKRTDWSLTFYLLVCSVGGMSYLIVEQVIGWRWNWWPRIFESLLPLLVVIPYLSNRHVWRPYAYWIRLKRPPRDIEISRTLSQHFNLANKNKLDGLVVEEHKPRARSSFFAPAPTFSTPSPTWTSFPLRIPEEPSREVFGPASSKQQDLASPPFAYSVTGTLSSGNSSPLSLPPKALERNDFSKLPWRTSRRFRLGQRDSHNIAEEADIASLSSKYSDTESGITSVFGTRHSRGSSPPQFTPARPVGGERESIREEIVFDGSRSAEPTATRVNEMPWARDEMRVNRGFETPKIGPSARLFSKARGGMI